MLYTVFRRLAVIQRDAGIPTSGACGNIPCWRYTAFWRRRKVCVKSVYRLLASKGLIIIMLAFLNCAAYIRMTMNESLPSCEQRRITFNDDGQRVQLVRPELPAPHYIGMSRHYYPRLIAGTNLPIPKGWTAWLAKADCTHITFDQGYYTIQFKGTRTKWTQVFGSKTNSIPVNQSRRTV